VHCYVIHLGLFAGGRRRQTDALIQAVSTSSPPDAPLLIAGDFNDWTNQLSRTLYQNLGVVEVFDQPQPTARGVMQGCAGWVACRRRSAPHLPGHDAVAAPGPHLRARFPMETAEVLSGWPMGAPVGPCAHRHRTAAGLILRHLAFTDGNQIALLHSGAGFYPALISAIDAARVEIYLETYIFASMRRECWSAKPCKAPLDAVLWSMSSMTGWARAAKILTNCASR
jgi:hypothetical protein